MKTALVLLCSALLWCFLIFLISLPVIEYKQWECEKKENTRYNVWAGCQYNVVKKPVTIRLEIDDE